MLPGSTYYAMVPMDSDKPGHLREFLAWLLAVSHHAGVPHPQLHKGPPARPADQCLSGE
jgi:hypothetical protein